MHSFYPTEFVKIANIAQKNRIKTENIFHAAGHGALPLFVSIPTDMCAYRIDIQHNDLASRTQLFINPEYDQQDIYRPVLLRLKPVDCAKLATENVIEAVDFPYAICLVGAQFPLPNNDGKKIASTQSFTTAQIPPDQEIFPKQLNSAPICWRLFHPNTEDLSNFLSLAVTSEMVVTSDYYMERITQLKKTGSRKQAGKSTAGYINRHERNRCLLVDAAEEVARKNPEHCNTLKNWSDEVYDLRDASIFEVLRTTKKTFSRDWVEKTLRERFDFAEGKPVKKTFTVPE